MKQVPLVKSVMTPFPYSLDIEASVDSAVEVMRQHKVRHLPVTERGELMGLVSDRDIKLVLGPDFAYPNLDEVRVRYAMVKHSHIVDLSTPLEPVLRHMAEHRLGSVLVTRRGNLAGVFTSTDACRSFADYLKERSPQPGNEAA